MRFLKDHRGIEMLEAAITTPIAGTIERRAIPSTQQVEAGDLLVVVAGK